MRLLPVRPDHVRFGAAGEQSASDRFRHRRRDVRQHLPLRDLCSHSRSHQAGRAIDRHGMLPMPLDHVPPRRGSRQDGANARTRVVAAAAKRWNVDPASCHAQRGEVLHAPTRRSIKYGELAADAARMPVPENVALKGPADFKLIGTPAKRLDTPAKVNGKAVYGIDVRPPGVKIATLAQSPVFGGRVKSVDDAAAKAVKGGRQSGGLVDAVPLLAPHLV